MNSCLSAPDPPSRSAWDAGTWTLGLFFVSWLPFSFCPQRTAGKDWEAKAGQGILASSCPCLVSTLSNDSSPGSGVDSSLQDLLVGWVGVGFEFDLGLELPRSNQPH